MKRIKQHNSGQVAATKDHRPWKPVYYEAYRSKLDALKREKRLKQFKNSYRELRKRIQQSIAAMR